MATVKVPIAQLVRDIKSYEPDSVLIEKYHITPGALLTAKQRLLQRRLVTPQDLKVQHASSDRGLKTIVTDEFLGAFRSLPRDSHLMKLYSLTPSQLWSIYRELLRQNLLSREAFAARNVKQRGLEQLKTVPVAVSDLIRVVDEDLSRRIELNEDESFGDLPKDMFRDYSGVKLGSHEQDEVGNAVHHHHGIHAGACARPEEEHRHEGKLCPRCGHFISQDASETCFSCDIEP